MRSVSTATVNVDLIQSAEELATLVSNAARLQIAVTTSTGDRDMQADLEVPRAFQVDSLARQLVIYAVVHGLAPAVALQQVKQQVARLTAGADIDKPLPTYAPVTE